MRLCEECDERPATEDVVIDGVVTELCEECAEWWRIHAPPGS